MLTCPRSTSPLSGAMPLSAPLAQKWEATGGLMIEGYGMTLGGSPLASRAHAGRSACLSPPRACIDDRIHPRRCRRRRRASHRALGLSGYWNQDDETAEVFTSDGWLRTGDLVRVRDGFIYMADRRKGDGDSPVLRLPLPGGGTPCAPMPGVADVALSACPLEEIERCRRTIVLGPAPR